MRIIYSSAIILVLLQGAFSYSKFGRKCEDIGCASNEECVMATKTCSYFDRQDECGQYPTCKKVSNSARTCQTYVCPPSKVCKMDGGIPKCFDDTGKVGSVPLYDTSNLNNRYNGNNGQNSGQNNPNAPNYGGHTNPSAPSAPREDSGSLYPSLGGGGSNYGQSGYRPQGGYSNPGYQQPGYGGYQQPGYGGYQQPAGNGGYNARPGGGYGQQNGYGSTGYNQGGYNRPQQGGYNGYGNSNPYGNNGYGYGQNTNRYGTKSGSTSSFSDTLTNALKKIGLLILVAYCINQNYWR